MKIESSERANQDQFVFIKESVKIGLIPARHAHSLKLGCRVKVISLLKPNYFDIKPCLADRFGRARPILL